MPLANLEEAKKLNHSPFSISIFWRHLVTVFPALRFESRTFRNDNLRRELEQFFGFRLPVDVMQRVKFGPQSPMRARGLATGSRIYFDEALLEDDLSLRCVVAHEVAHLRQKSVYSGEAAPDLVLESEAASAAVAFLSGGNSPALSPDESAAPRWFGPAGHFYTALYIGLATGLQPKQAYEIARYTQLPDEIVELDATGVYRDWWGATILPLSIGTENMRYDPVPGFLRSMYGADIAYEMLPPALFYALIQRGLHCLTGKDATKEQEFRLEKLESTLGAADPFLIGLSLHAYADSFAHRTIDNEEVMYGDGLGHAVEGVHGIRAWSRGNLDMGLDIYDITFRISFWGHLVDNITFRPETRYKLFATKAFGAFKKKYKTGNALSDNEFQRDIDWFSKHNVQVGDEQWCQKNIAWKINQRWPSVVVKGQPLRGFFPSEEAAGGSPRGKSGPSTAAAAVTIADSLSDDPVWFSTVKDDKDLSHYFSTTRFINAIKYAKPLSRLPVFAQSALNGRRPVV